MLLCLIVYIDIDWCGLSVCLDLLLRELKLIFVMFRLNSILHLFLF